MNITRIVAWVGIVTLVGLYIAALVASLLGNNELFSVALYSTFVIPAVVFVLEMLIKRTEKNRKDWKEFVEQGKDEAGEGTGAPKETSK
ncbi:MAG: hypothetical protein J6113_03750 [Lachnospiraceae bacterium]|nr:hypothetical protein [Lachnospiraceae bacterium]